MTEVIEVGTDFDPETERRLAEAKRRYAEATAERQRIYAAIERLEQRRRNRGGVVRRLKRALGIT